MLLSNNVETMWNKRNKLQYEKLGYVFTGYGDTLILDVSHAPSKKDINIELICDNCNIKFYRKSEHYITSKRRQKKEDRHLDYCKECSLKINKIGFQNAFNYKMSKKPLKLWQIIDRNL